MWNLRLATLQHCRPATVSQLFDSIGSWCSRSQPYLGLAYPHGCSVRRCHYVLVLFCNCGIHDIVIGIGYAEKHVHLSVAKGIHGQRATLMLLALLLSTTDIMAVYLTVCVLLCAMQDCCMRYPCPHSCVLSRHAHCKSCLVCFCCSYSLTHGIPCYKVHRAFIYLTTIVHIQHVPLVQSFLAVQTCLSYIYLYYLIWLYSHQEMNQDASIHEMLIFLALTNVLLYQ